MQTILGTSSVSNRSKKVHISHDKTTTFIDHYEDGNLVAHFTMDRADWELFVMAEYAEIR